MAAITLNTPLTDNSVTHYTLPLHCEDTFGGGAAIPTKGLHSSASLIRIQSPGVKHNNATMPVSTAAKPNKQQPARKEGQEHELQSLTLDLGVVFGLVLCTFDGQLNPIA